MKPEAQEKQLMTRNVEAVYTNGVFKPLQPIDLAENQKVTLTIADGAADVAALQTGVPPQFANRDEWQEAIRSWAARHAPTGTDADWSRESIYAGRGE